MHFGSVFRLWGHPALHAAAYPVGIIFIDSVCPLPSRLEMMRNFAQLTKASVFQLPLRPGLLPSKVCSVLPFLQYFNLNTACLQRRHISFALRPL